MDNNFNQRFGNFADILQLANFAMLMEDANNTDLLHQDNDFLNKIIEQNEIIIDQNKQIINLLKGGK